MSGVGYFHHGYLITEKPGHLAKQTNSQESVRRLV